MLTRLRVLALSVVCALLTSQGVHAGETNIPEFFIICKSKGQRCTPAFSTQIDTGSRLQVRYFVSNRHCSSIRAHISVDGTLKATTPFLGWPGGPPPLDTGLVDLGAVSPGRHVLSIQAEGQRGGCNRGELHSWGGRATVVTDVVAEAADLRVTKTGPATVLAGSDVGYTVTVTNNGPSAARSVSLADPLPANATFVSATQNSGPPFGCTASGGAVSCATATLASGASATFTFVYNAPLATPAGRTITNRVSVTSATSDPVPGNNSASASTTVMALDWKLIPQNMGGTSFPVHFQATVPGGALILAVLNRVNGDGVALGFVPQPVARLDWQQVTQNTGGTPFPDHFQATVPGGGALIVSVLNRVQGTGVGLGFVPQPVTRLDWQAVPQNAGGTPFPDPFQATVPGGALIVSVLNRQQGSGVGLGFVPQRVTRLDWQQIPQNAGGTPFPNSFAAPAAGGALIVAVLNRVEGDGVALDFVPQAVSRLDWQQIQQNLGGPLNPTPFRAVVPRGALIVSVLNRQRGTGTGLVFVP